MIKAAIHKVIGGRQEVRVAPVVGILKKGLISQYVGLLGFLLNRFTFSHSYTNICNPKLKLCREELRELWLSA